MTATERMDAEARHVIRIVAEIIDRDLAGNWADQVDSALIDAGIDLDGVEQPDGSDPWEILRYRAADGAICLVYLADEGSAADTARYRVIEEESATPRRGPRRAARNAVLCRRREVQTMSTHELRWASRKEDCVVCQCGWLAPAGDLRVAAQQWLSHCDAAGIGSAAAIAQWERRIEAWPWSYYVVRQLFETLGDPCAEHHESLESAEDAAERLRGEIAMMVQSWEVDQTTQPTGWASEIAAWREAEFLADGSECYGPAAAALIAARAVEIIMVENQE